MLSNRRVILLIGTGASRKGGLIEAEWIKKFLIDNVFKIMKKFSVFENIPLSLADRVIINRISRTDIISTTTFEEAGETARIVEMLNPDMIFLVSDPVHILRCRRDFILALRGKGLFNSSILVFCISSYIPYQGNTNIYINERKKGGAFNPNFS